MSVDELISPVSHDSDDAAERDLEQPRRPQAAQMVSDV